MKVGAHPSLSLIPDEEIGEIDCKQKLD